MPIRNRDRRSRLFAVALPDPFTVLTVIQKSFTIGQRFCSIGFPATIVSSDISLLYVMNHGKTPGRAVIRIKVKSDGKYALNEILRDRKINATSVKGEISISTNDIPVKDGQIWLIEKAR